MEVPTKDMTHVRIVELMKKGRKDVNVCREGCKVLTSMSYSNDDSAQAACASSGVADAVVIALTEHKDEADVAKYGCGVLGNMALNCSGGVAACLSAQVVPAVLRALEVHKNNTDVCKKALDALRNIAVSADGEAACLSAGAMQATVSTITRHMTVGAVCEKGFTALSNMASSNAGKAAFLSTGAVPVVVRGLASHPRSEEVCWRGCMALSSIAGSAAGLAAYLSGGVAPAVVAAMSAHEGSEDVCKYGSLVLQDMSESAAGAAACLSAGAAPAVVAAMNAHGGSEELCERASGALKGMAGSAAGAAACLSAGAAPAVVAAMSAHGGSDYVSKYASGALKGMAGSAAGAAACLSAGALPALSAANAKHRVTDARDAVALLQAAEQEAKMKVASAAEKAAAEKAERERIEKAAKEKAERERIEKAAKEKAEREAAEKADAERKAAAEKREQQGRAISDALALLESKSVDKVGTAFARAVTLGVSRDAPSLAPVVLWLALEAAFASAVDGMHANDVVRARAAVAEAKRLGVTSTRGSRLEPIVAWLAREDPIAASVAAMAAGKVSDTKLSLDEALRLGLSSADARAAKVQDWLANEAAKEAAIVAAVSNKSAGSAADARRSAEEAQRLGADRNEARLQSVSSWVAQEDAIASSQAAMTAMKLSDARSASNEARRLGVAASDSRLKAVLDWIANEDAKEAAVASAQSAVTARSVARTQSSYDEAVRLGVPSSDSRLVVVKKWLRDEAAKEAAIVETIKSLSICDGVKTKSVLSKALELGVDEDDPRIVDVNIFFSSTEVNIFVSISDLSAVDASISKALKLGVPSRSSFVQSARAWQKKMQQDMAIQKCKECMNKLDRAGASVSLSEALIEKSDPRAAHVQSWISDIEGGIMQSARNTLTQVNKSHPVVGALATLSSEVLSIIEKKTSSKHLIEASTAVLEIAPTLMNVSSRDPSEPSKSVSLYKEIESLTQSLNALVRCLVPWNKKGLFEKLSFSTGVSRPCDVALQGCVGDVRARLIAFNLAVAEQIRDSTISQALQGVHSYDVDRARARLYDAIVAGVQYEDIRLGPVKSWIVDATRAISYLSSWFQQHVNAFLEANANEISSLLFKVGVKTPESIARSLQDDSDWLRKAGVNASDASEIIVALVNEKLYSKALKKEIDTPFRAGGGMAAFFPGGSATAKDKRSQARDDRDRILYDMEISPDLYQLSPEPIVRSKSPTSADIYLAEMDGRVMCAKVFELIGLTPAEKADIFSSFKKELATIRQCLHVSIVRVFGATTTLPNRLVMLMEYVQRGNLRQLLDSGVLLSIERKMKIIRSIASGMHYLYSRSTPIQHRDLKSPNVLIDDDERAKIIDFGLSSSAISMSSTTAASLKTTGYLGTPQWSSPQVLDDQPFTEKSDVYSFAVITWEVLTERRPWDEKGLSVASLIKKVCVKNERPSPLPTNVDPRLLALLQAMWAPEPDDRPSFKSIIQELDLIIVSQQDEKAAGSVSTVSLSPLPRASTEERKKAMWHEAARQNAKSICHIDVLVYGGVWETMLRNEGDNLKRLGKSVERLRARMPKDKTLQPQLGGFETTTPDYLHLLKEAHEDVDKSIFNEAESVAKKLGLKFKRGPNKKNERIFEKADLCYNGDYSQITDLRRGSVICPTVADVNKTVVELLDTPGLDIVRLKDRLDMSYNAKEESLGYRDIQLNVRVTGPIPIIWELQLHIEAMENVKTGQDGLLDAAGREGHARYKAYREMMERLKKLEADGVFGPISGYKGGGGGSGP